MRQHPYFTREALSLLTFDKVLHASRPIVLDKLNAGS
jgi:hypothetical protein